MKYITIFIINILAFWSISAQTIIFEDGFESGTFKSEWNPQPGTNGIITIASSIQGVNGVAYTGQNGVAIGKSSDDGVTTTNKLDLHLDLSAHQNVDLSFAIRDYFDVTNTNEGIYFSQDGNTFIKVYDFDPSNWINEYGMLPPIDVDEYAAAHNLSLTANFVIRFQQEGFYDFTPNAVSGFFIDDVKVVGGEITYTTLPFNDDFESGVLGNMWRWANPLFPAQTTLASTVRPGGLVEVASNVQGVQVPQHGLYGVAMGRRSGGDWTTNALDLYLNLSSYNEVELSYWISDVADDTHVQDGIYFSQDGGQSFVKVYDFLPSGWVNEYGKLPPLDVDGLASANGLSLTSTFVIRFQQYGWQSFAGDGFLIDNVSVYSPTYVYAVPPFSQDFESGQLGNSFKWSDPLFPSATTDAGTVRPGGLVEVLTTTQGVQIPHLGLYGVAIGRRNNGDWTTNALDLLLDLSHHREVTLSFWIKDIFDESHERDRIYYSPNGGLNFFEIYDYDPSDLPNNNYSQIMLNLDSLVANVGLQLTDRAVIRFQQYGWQSFAGNDGICIDDISVSADSTIVGIDDPVENSGLPEQYVLRQNYPNPFNPTTTIEYTLPRAEKVHLTVFNMLGQQVATLVNGEQMQPGVHSATFDAADLPSGVYYYRLTAGAFSETKKMLLVQ